MKEEKTPSVLRFPESTQNTTPDYEPQRDIVVRERKIWDWIVQHAQLLVRIACIAVVVSGVVIAFRWMNERKAQKYLRAYQSKTTLSERIAWVESASSPTCVRDIRGFTFLESANDHMRKKEYERALGDYRKAKSPLKVSPLSEEAALGLGFAALHVSDLNVAEKEFQLLCKSTSKYVNAQALYGLCYIAGKRGDLQNFSHYKTKLVGYDPGNGLTTQIEVLFPDLAKQH